MSNAKNILSSKTFWFNALAFVVAVASAFGYTGELPSELSQFVLPVVFVINIILRYLTNQAVKLPGQ